MKRINLSVDFEDNELFDKSLRDSLKAELKTLIRNNYMDMLKDVIEPECERLITKNVTIIQKYLANIDNKINSIIKEVMTQKVTDALNDILTK